MQRELLDAWRRLSGQAEQHVRAAQRDEALSIAEVPAQRTATLRSQESALEERLAARETQQRQEAHVAQLDVVGRIQQAAVGYESLRQELFAQAQVEPRKMEDVVLQARAEMQQEKDMRLQEVQTARVLYIRIHGIELTAVNVEQ